MKITNLVVDDTLYLDKGDTFILKKGKNINSNNLINLALEKEPSLIYTNQKLNNKNIKKINIKKYEKEILKNNKINPVIIGITGTNGKTSTSTIIYKTLKDNGKKVMLIGSNGVFYSDKFYKTRNTTISSLSINYLINKFLDNDSYLVIELSSQGYSRVKHLKLDYLIFTNLSNEHLDYHKTMTRYFKAKLRIINLLKDKSKLYVNYDDKYGKIIAKKISLANKYSLNDLTINNINPIELTIKENYIKSNLKGEFNIYNLYSSYLVLKNIIDDKKIIESFQEIVINGRNNEYCFNNKNIIIDYAHTPDSFRNIISFYNKVKMNNLYILFGFGGNKDKKKRKLMLEEAYKFSNNIILCEDNSRNEPFFKIMKSAIKKNYDGLIIIENREKAIKYAINQMEINDYLLILGKGNEEYLLKNNKIIKYSDYEVIKSCFF